MSTLWTLMRRAHEGHGPEARDAQSVCIERYRRAAYRYLLGAVRDPDQAEELFQEFAFRFVRGDFRNARREVGRFRDYLRSALSHMIDDHRRSQRRSPAPLNDDVPAQAAETSADDDDAFLGTWRTEMMNQAWSALQAENDTHHAVLLHYVSNPDCSAADAAAAVTVQLGKPITVANIRVILHRARQRFADLITEEVAQTLDSPTRQELAEELRVLNLTKLCKRSLRSWHEAKR